MSPGASTTGEPHSFLSYPFSHRPEGPCRAESHRRCMHRAQVPASGERAGREQTGSPNGYSVGDLGVPGICVQATPSAHISESLITNYLA